MNSSITSFIMCTSRNQEKTGFLTIQCHKDTKTSHVEFLFKGKTLIFLGKKSNNSNSKFLTHKIAGSRDSISRILTLSYTLPRNDFNNHLCMQLVKQVFELVGIYILHKRNVTFMINKSIYLGTVHSSAVCRQHFPSYEAL